MVQPPLEKIGPYAYATITNNNDDTTIYKAHTPHHQHARDCYPLLERVNITILYRIVSYL